MLVLNILSIKFVGNLCLLYWIFSSIYLILVNERLLNISLNGAAIEELLWAYQRHFWWLLSLLTFLGLSQTIIEVLPSFLFICNLLDLVEILLVIPRLVFKSLNIRNFLILQFPLFLATTPFCWALTHQHQVFTDWLKFFKSRFIVFYYLFLHRFL